MSAVSSQLSALVDLLNRLFPAQDLSDNVLRGYTQDVEDLMAECVFFVDRLNFRAKQYGLISASDAACDQKARQLSELYTQAYQTAQRLLLILRVYRERGIQVDGVEPFLVALADAEFAGPRFEQLLAAGKNPTIRTHAEVRDAVHRRMGIAS